MILGSFTTHGETMPAPS